MEFASIKTSLSLVIPAYNEEACIERTVNEAIGYLEEKGFDYEVIVVCDGCSDDTAAIAKRIGLKNERVRVVERETNIGKGYTVKEGCLAATGEFVVYTDADLSTPVTETERLVKWLQDGYGVVIGSRAHNESDISIRQSRHRELMGKFFNFLVRTLVLGGFKDTQCGFKGFSREAAQRVFPLQTINGFAYDVEVLYIARKLGYRIKEIPVRWRNREESRVRLLTHPLQMIAELLSIRVKDLVGRYGT